MAATTVTGNRDSSVDLFVLLSCGPGFETQAKHLRFIFVITFREE